MLVRLRIRDCGCQGRNPLVVWYDGIVEGETKKPWTQDVKWWQALLVSGLVLSVLIVGHYWLEGPDKENRIRILTACAYSGFPLLYGSAFIYGGLSSRSSLSKWVWIPLVFGSLALIATTIVVAYRYLFLMQKDAEFQLRMLISPPLLVNVILLCFGVFRQSRNK